ncbi:type IA DNA topoisomerase, partial [Capnocytophaga canis]|uniref:type IA DNA topoisomerase n=2 Tax=Capnocytophaga TaxID=1016 RepID=UPI0037D8E4C2
LQVAQGLYEQKYITYPRTGSKYISEDVWAEIPSLIRLLQESDPFSASAKLVKITALNKRMVNDLKVTDHHGLLITERFPTNLSAKEHTIYKMIAFRLLEAVSEPCVKEVQKISLEVFHKCFTMKNTQVTQTGWRGVNGFLSDSNKDEADICEALPSLPKGSTLKIKSVEILSKTTQPPALYTEAGLLSAMETAGRDLESKQQRQLLQGSGIGTPATRAAIIETLLKRGYVVRKQKSLIPTEKGLQVYHWVKEDDIANVTLTGQWEEDLQKIEQGEKSPTEFLRAMKSYTQDLTQTLLELDIPQKKHLQLCCPKCQQQTLKIFEKVVKCPDENCNWTFFRNICGKNIDEQTLKTLLETRKSPLIKAMKSKTGKTFDAYLVLNENAETSFEFPKKKSK